MKRIIILTFILLLIFSTAVGAESSFKAEFGLFDMRDADDYLTGARLDFRTDLLVLLDMYDFLEVKYLRAGNFDSQLSYDHAIHDLDLLLVNQASYRLSDLNIGLGGKYLLIENSASNSSVLDEDYSHDNNNIDIEGYGLPVVINSQDDLGENIKLEVQGQLLPIGRYEIALDDRGDISAEFRGYGIEATFKVMTHDNFSLQVGGSWQRYRFLEDESIALSQEFTDGQSGIFSGIEIIW